MAEQVIFNRAPTKWMSLAARVPRAVLPPFAADQHGNRLCYVR